MSDPSLPGGKKLCPQCTTYVGVNDAICGNCGYNFGTGAEGPGGTEGAGTGGTDEGQPFEPLTVYAPDSGLPGSTGRWAGRAILIVVLVVILGIGGIIAFVTISVTDKATDIIDNIPGVGEFTFTSDPGGGTNQATDSASCQDIITRYQRKVLANDGQPADLPEVIGDAATEMGPGSFEFQAFTTIYSSANGIQTAITDGTKAALKKTKKDVKNKCEERYG